MINRSVLSFIAITGLLLLINSCKQEYSFEGGPPPPPQDTVILPPPPPPSKVCPACIGQEDFIENKWSFRDDTLLCCGIIDTAIVAPARQGFTFYGPSACSNDTGMVITVPLEGQILNQNLSNITLTHTAFYYYDNVGQAYIYMSHQANPFTVHINSYDHATKLVTGTFEGYVYNARGPGGTMIRNGKFKVKLH
ncbi:MAG TPA: hypothetical protein PKC72_15390 [Chitinophagaceae bacterium]|nr:hypothetical protein [Chitinophagaceae bacterium]